MRDIRDTGWYKDPEFQRQLRRTQRRIAAVERITGWMKHIPVVGSVVYTFWFCVLDEGIKATMKPRWGALTFSFLNDGMKPTLWHTWRQITHGQDDPYTGIYVSGAPKSLAQAQEWERKWKEEREAVAWAGYQSAVRTDE